MSLLLPANLALGQAWNSSSQIQVQGEDAVTDGFIDTCVVTRNEKTPTVTLDLGRDHMISHLILRQDYNQPGMI